MEIFFCEYLRVQGKCVYFLPWSEPRTALSGLLCVF